MERRADLSRHESQPTMTIAAGLSFGCPVSRAQMSGAPSLFAAFPDHENLSEAGL